MWGMWPMAILDRLVQHDYRIQRRGDPMHKNRDGCVALAGFARSYSHAPHGGDSSREEAALRWVCTGLEYRLGAPLEGKDGWLGWGDGILPATDMLPDFIRVISEVELRVRGRAVGG